MKVNAFLYCSCYFCIALLCRAVNQLDLGGAFQNPVTLVPLLP